MDLYPADFRTNPSKGAYSPRFFDSRPGVPGVTHIGVGRLPVAVEGGPKGRIAYTLNQVDRSITRVDLLNLKKIEPSIPLPATPTTFAVTAGGDIVTIYADRPVLTIHPGTSCSGPGLDSCAPKGTAITPTSTLTLPGYPSDVAISRSVANAELAKNATNLNNHKNLAFVSYRDRNDISVIALDAAALGSETCVDGTTNAPCLVKNIPLTYGCSDGIDNDGDGKVDAKDPQCINPWDAEGGMKPGPSDPSRGLPGECNDGKDNDNDGRVDSEDPDCMTSGGMSESPGKSAPVTACNDGIDNDGDGKVDHAGGAPGCYLPYSIGELLPPAFGFDKISVDPTGSVVWVLDRANNQVLLVDVVRGRLIDVPKSSEPPTTPYNALLGIPIPGRPISLQARIYPRKEFGSAAERSSIYFSAYVGSDNGYVYNVDAFKLSCPDGDFEKCLALPAFPLTNQENSDENKKTCPAGYAPTCSCPPSDMGPTGGAISNSDTFEEMLQTTTCGCNAAVPSKSTEFLKQHTYCQQDQTEILVTPLFSVGDSGNGFADVPVIGQCSVPESMFQKIIGFSQSNQTETSDPASCNSIIIPQPRSENAADTIDPATHQPVSPSKISFNKTARVTLTRQFEPAYRVDQKGDNGYTIISSPLTRAIVNEEWKVTFQGVLPPTKAAHWTLAPSKDPAKSILYADIDLCEANVRKGDIFEIKTLPRPNCTQFDGTPDFLRYKIIEVTPQSITIEQISGKAPLPTQGSCFPTEMMGSVRAAQEWVIDRKSGIYYSSQRAQGGQCVPSMISEAHDNRMKSGEIFVSPGLSFKLYNGFVTPDEDLEYTFDAQSNYRPTRYRPEESRTDAITGDLPHQLSYYSNFRDNLDLFLVADPTANLLWINLTLPTRVASENNSIQPSTFRFVLK